MCQKAWHAKPRFKSLHDAVANQAPEVWLSLDGVHFQARPLGWVHWSRFGGLQGSYQSASWANKDSESALIAVCVLPGAEIFAFFWTPSLSPFTCSHCVQSMQSTRARKSSCLRNWGLGNVASRACWKMTRASLPCTWLAITPAYMCLYEFHKCIQILSNILITDDKLEVSRTLKQALKACK